MSKITALATFKQTFHKYLVVNDDTYVDVFFGVIFANRLASKPVWLYLVGPASSGKTDLIQAVDGHSTINAQSKITQHTLISGWKNAGKRKTEECSLLPKLNGKILTIKDFTSMLTMKHETLHDILGVLRDAYDGKVTHTFGTGETKSFVTKFGVIAAVTNVIDKHKGVLADLGERFLTFRMPDLTEREVHARQMKAATTKNDFEKEKAISEAAHMMLDLEPAIPSIHHTQVNLISRIARFAAIARCAVRRDRYSKEAEFPQAEVPVRLAKQLTDLARGIAMARQKLRVTNKEVNLVRKIALHSATYKRLRLIRALLAFSDASISDIQTHYPFSTKQVRTDIQDLELLGVINRSQRLAAGGQIIDTFAIKQADLLHQISKKG